MGCDIHAHLEIKVKGEWLHYSIPHFKRDYRLFGKLAGVRDESVEPIAEPRGLPTNLSTITALDAKLWKMDGHTFSWINADEIRKVIEFHEQLYEKDGKNEFTFLAHYDEWGYLFGNTWSGFTKYRDEYPKEIEDIRMVFWFDN